MTEQEAINTSKEWEVNGFKFIGNGTENNDECPLTCPNCGDDYVFWALWEHPTKQRHAETESEYNSLLLNSINSCLSCGWYWIDEDETNNEVD